MLNKYGDQETLHHFEFAQKTKPLTSIKNVYSKLETIGKPFELNTGMRLSFKDEKQLSHIILLVEGCFSIYHQSSELNIGIGFSPTILNLVGIYNQYHEGQKPPRHFMVAETHCKGFKVPLETFIEQCNKHYLWPDISQILVQRLMVMSMIEEHLVCSDAYSAVRSILLEIWLYPEDIRNKFNITNVIQRRTNLSRSRVMDILSALKQGGYIKIRKGKLIEVDFLPKAF